MPAADQRSPDQRRLDTLRAALSGGPVDYRMEADAEATRLYEPETGALVATIHHACAHADRDRVLASIFDMDWLLACYDRAVKRIRAQDEAEAQRREAEERRRNKDDLARACAIEAAKPLFMAFLRERHGLKDGADRGLVEIHVRGILAIQSRTELNTNPAAAQRWKSLWAEFQQWRKT